MLYDHKENNEEKALLQIVGGLEYCPNLTIKIDRQKTGRIVVAMQTMYEYVPATLKVLSAVGEFFNTDKVNVLGQDHIGGCETCDYGSRYYIEFEVLP